MRVPPAIIRNIKHLVARKLIPMASFKISMIIAMAAVLVPSILATEFIVGDESGWTTNFDYQAWAAGRKFHVGDVLVFRYPGGVHNVMRVNGSDFQGCSAPANTEAMSSGKDRITLTSPGNKWYICSVGKHCESGNMKLAISVLSEVAPATSPSPADQPPQSSAATGRINYASGYYYGWIVAIATIVVILVA